MRHLFLMAAVSWACQQPHDTDPGDTAARTFITINGTVFDIAADGPGEAGSCLHVFDPSSMVTGGAPDEIGQTTVTTGGAFTLEDVSVASTFGLIWTVRDCDTGPAYPTTSGVDYADYAALEDGDTLAGQTAFVLTDAYVEALAQAAAESGYAGSLVTEGFIHGWTLDAEGTPIAGVTVSCEACGPVYYPDATGSFSAPDGALATATDARGLFIIPAAPLSTYEASSPRHTFAAVFASSNPGEATTIALFSN